MKNFWRGFRKASDLREREERAALRQEFLKEVSFLIATFGYEGEDMFRDLNRRTFPEKTEAQMEEDARRYRAAVNERRSLREGW